MLWFVSLIPLVIAFAYRAYVNRGQTWGTPDERVYSTYAKKWRSGGTFRSSITSFLDKPKLEIPPTRYGFFALCAGLSAIFSKTDPYRTVTWIAAISGALSAWVAFQVTRDLPSSLLVASSALSLLLSRRALQDTFAALTILLGVWAVALQNVWLLSVATFIALASREALLLFLPALFAAWFLRTGHWLTASVALTAGTIAAIAGFHALGGRNLLAIFRKLREKTDYVQRVQAGMPHRVLVDLVLMSPVTTAAAFAACLRAPLWLVSFVGVSLLVHAFITPKNVRFLLAVDVGLRMLCAYLPGHWTWAIMIVGTISDYYLYRAFGQSKDPVTYDLVLKSGMFIPPEQEVRLK